MKYVASGDLGGDGCMETSSPDSGCAPSPSGTCHAGATELFACTWWRWWWRGAPLDQPLSIPESGAKQHRCRQRGHLLDGCRPLEKSGHGLHGDSPGILQRETRHL